MFLPIGEAIHVTIVFYSRIVSPGIESFYQTGFRWMLPVKFMFLPIDEAIHVTIVFIDAL